VFTPEQYSDLARTGNTPNEVREFQTHERSLTMLAENKQWLADNDDKLADNLDEMPPVLKPCGDGKATLAAEEEHILRCLGAALIRSGTRCRQGCKGTSSIMPVPWASYWTPPL
jgi:hypothetical protein